MESLKVSPFFDQFPRQESPEVCDVRPPSSEQICVAPSAHKGNHSPPGLFRGITLLLPLAPSRFFVPNHSRLLLSQPYKHISTSIYDMSLQSSPTPQVRLNRWISERSEELRRIRSWDGLSPHLPVRAQDTTELGDAIPLGSPPPLYSAAPTTPPHGLHCRSTQQRAFSATETLPAYTDKPFSTAGAAQEALSGSRQLLDRPSSPLAIQTRTRTSGTDTPAATHLNPVFSRDGVFLPNINNNRSPSVTDFSSPVPLPTLFDRTVGAGRPAPTARPQPSGPNQALAARSPPPTYNHVRFTRALDANATFSPSDGRRSWRVHDRRMRPEPRPAAGRGVSINEAIRLHCHCGRCAGCLALRGR